MPLVVRGPVLGSIEILKSDCKEVGILNRDTHFFYFNLPKSAQIPNDVCDVLVNTPDHCLNTFKQ